MKTILFILLLLSCCHIATAQTDSSVAIVRYTLSHISDTTQPENPVNNDYVLYIGNNLSWYTYDRPPIRQMGALSGGTFSGSIGGAGAGITPANLPPATMEKIERNNTYMKDRNASQLIYLTLPVVTEQLFAVTEPIPAIEWNIHTDTKTIMGLECQKATGSFKGRDYEAWFTSLLPYSNGPWKLGGLPGLIVEAYDTKKEVIFTLRAVETGKPVAISMPASTVKTSPKEYAQYKDAIEKDRNAGKGAMNGMLVVSNMSMRGADGKMAKPRQMNNPIEKQQ